MKKTKAVKTRLKKGDEVIVIAGKYKTQKGEVLSIDRKEARIYVKGVNLRKKYARPTQEAPKGGVFEIEGPLHISNVMAYDAKSKKRSRISVTKDKNGNKVRKLVASGKELE